MCSLVQPADVMFSCRMWSVLFCGLRVSMGFPSGSVDEESACNSGDAGDAGSIPGSGRSPREGNGNPPQCSWLENPMDGGAWWATIQWVTKSRTWLSNQKKKKRVNIVFDWAGCGSYLQKEHLKESYCYSQFVAVNWGMWNFVQVSMWKAPLKTEMLERWRLTLVRSQLCLSGPTIVNKRSKMLKFCSRIYCIIICCIMTCSMHM